MCHKSSARRMEENKGRFMQLASGFDVMAAMAGDNTQFAAKLAAVKKSVTAFIPSDDKRVAKSDAAIEKKCDKLKKTILKASKRNDYRKAEKLLKEIRILIVERGCFAASDLDTRPEDYNVTDGVLVKYVGNGGVIALPANVTTIKEEAFAYRNDITSVVIPYGVKTIEGRAFYCCGSLTSVTLSEGLISLGESAFYNCKLLADVTLEDGLASIGRYTFSKCPLLTALKFPDTLRTIGDKAFEFDPGLCRKTRKKIKKFNKKALG